MVSGGLPSSLDALIEAVEGLDVAPVTDELVAALRTMDRLRAKVVEALSVFFRTGGPAADGFSNHRSWLRAHVAVTERDASLLVSWAKRAVDWPALAKLWFDGELSGAQYAAVCARIRDGRLIELYADHDTEVSPLLVGLSVSDTKSAIDQWATMAESVTSPDPADVEIPEPGTPLPVDGELKVSRYGEGEKRLAINADLDPDSGTIVQHALAAAMPKLVEGDTRSHAQRQAEAWVRICERYLAHPDLEGGAGPAAHMVVVAELADLYRNALWGLGIHTADHLDHFLTFNPVSAVEEGWLRDALAHSTGTLRTLDGWPLTPPAITSLFGTGSTLERLMLADSQVLDHGRKTRLFKGGLRTVVKVHDKKCRYGTASGEPCGAPVAWTQVHHPNPWENGGCTSHLNGLLLCPAHHALVHSPGWHTILDPDGTAHFRRPDGTTITSPPPWATRPPRLPLHHPHIDAIPRRLPEAPADPTVPAHDDPRALPHAPAAARQADAAATVELVTTGATAEGAQLGAPGEAADHLGTADTAEADEQRDPPSDRSGVESGDPAGSAPPPSGANPPGSGTVRRTDSGDDPGRQSSRLVGAAHRRAGRRHAATRRERWRHPDGPRLAAGHRAGRGRRRRGDRGARSGGRA